jgi:hypothetical protein
MKFRIVEITQGNTIHYEVQKRFLIFWITETYFDCCIDALMAGDYPLQFDSVEKAENYIENKGVKKEIVKYEIVKYEN